jgi:carboxymethylenebutenolidase
MKKLLLSLVAAALIAAGCPTEPSTNIQPTMSVTEAAIHDGDLYGAFFVKDPAPSSAPGLLIVHEWWGLNDQVKDEARKLADQGYAVFAIDLYDGEVAKDAARAGELAGKVRSNPAEAERKMKLALDFLEKQESVDKTRLASLGWCFGGGMSNILASSGDPRIKASVVYYGTPTTDATRLKNISRPILGIWGEDDQSIKAADVRAFEEKLKAQGTPVEFHYYAGAGHAFANPTRGDAYRQDAAADAWQKTLDFLKRELGM